MACSAVESSIRQGGLTWQKCAVTWAEAIHDVFFTSVRLHLVAEVSLFTMPYDRFAILSANRLLAPLEIRQAVERAAVDTVVAIDHPRKQTDRFYEI